MKTIIIIFMLITTQAFAEVVKIETGESDIKNKLTRIGADDMTRWHPNSEWATWILHSSDFTIDISVYKGKLIESIYV